MAQKNEKKEEVVVKKTYKKTQNDSLEHVIATIPKNARVLPYVCMKPYWRRLKKALPEDKKSKSAGNE